MILASLMLQLTGIGRLLHGRRAVLCRLTGIGVALGWLMAGLYPRH